MSSSTRFLGSLRRPRWAFRPTKRLRTPVGTDARDVRRLMRREAPSGGGVRRRRRLFAEIRQAVTSKKHKSFGSRPSLVEPEAGQRARGSMPGGAGVRSDGRGLPRGGSPMGAAGSTHRRSAHGGSALGADSELGARGLRTRRSGARLAARGSGSRPGSRLAARGSGGSRPAARGSRLGLAARARCSRLGRAARHSGSGSRLATRARGSRLAARGSARFPRGGSATTLVGPRPPPRVSPAP